MRLLEILSISVIYALAPKGIKDLKDDPLVEFAFDFPKNPFPTFAIDEPHLLRINMTNNSPLTKTVFGLTGFYTNPTDSSKDVRKINTDTVKYVVKPGKVAYLKYRFTPQMQAGEVGFYVLVDYYDQDEPAYKSVGAIKTIKVAYNDSPYDLQSISIYVMFAGIVGLAIKYLLTPSASTEGGKPAKKVKKEVKEVEKPTEPSMEWLPPHVINTAAKSASPKTTTKKRK